MPARSSPYAGLWPRLLAFALDYLILGGYLLTCEALESPILPTHVNIFPQEYILCPIFTPSSAS